MKNIIESGGGFLLVKYDSLSQLMASIYPQYQWNQSNFVHPQVGIWKDKELANYYIEWLKKNSSPKELQYLQVITDKREPQKEDVLMNMLSQVSPQFDVNAKKGSKKSQLMLKETLNLLFYGEGKQ